MCNIVSPTVTSSGAIRSIAESRGLIKQISPLRDAIASLRLGGTFLYFREVFLFFLTTHNSPHSFLTT